MAKGRGIGEIRASFYGKVRTAGLSKVFFILILSKVGEFKTPPV